MADQLSLGALSEQSGVAKSMISQIEKNETNPTIATLSRLSQALGTTLGHVLSANESTSTLVEKLTIKDTPLLKSEDGLCELRIIGWIETVEWVQWYDFRAEVGGKLESSAHPMGSVENLTILQGTVRVTSGEDSFSATAGQTLRYRADQDHLIENIGTDPVHATMVNILAHNLRTTIL